jgi:uncharacterized tellurite resistance protein B-like protein
MSILDYLGFLGLGPGGPVHEAPARPSSAMEHIVDRLKDMPAEEAEWIAAFAMVMARAARADFEISQEEEAAIEQLLQEYGGLDPEQASLVVEMVTKRNLLIGAGDDYLATREFRRIGREGGRERILYCLFAVSAADDSISLVEEEEIRQVASELGIEHGEFTAVRAKFREKRAVLRGRDRSQP